MADSPALPALFLDALDRADATLVAGWYRAVSVPTERVRAWLRFRRLPFADPASADTPRLGELDGTADVVIARAAAAAGTLGGAAGVAGMASVPPEAVATVVLVLRLGQRLCVVYGFDPGTDRGQMALARALAAAWQVELPETGAFGLRVSEIPAMFRPGASPRAVGARLARAMAVGAIGWVASRITRLVPLVSAPAHALDHRAKIGEAGRRMVAVLRRLADAPDGPPLLVEDAEEVG